MKILINNLGYYPKDIKIGKLIGIKEIVHFEVYNEKGICVFKDTNTLPRFDKNTEEYVSEIDFSSINEIGKFHIKIKNINSSFFTINTNVFDKLEDSLTYMFYLQQCGKEVIDSKYKIFSHEECHSKKAVIYGTEKYIDVTGGYHDAGDFGRYITPGAKMVMELLLSYEISGKEEVLNVARYELDFFKKMIRSDGAVYHKVTGYNFSNMIMPDKDTNSLVISPVSTTATADFAAVMAFASTIIKDKSEEYLELAKLAYNFLMKNENIPFYNPKEITTGQYEDDKSRDEIYLAKISLYNATNDLYYLDGISEYFPLSIDEVLGLGWEEMSLFGTYLFLRNKTNSSNPIYSQIRNKLKQNLDILVQRSNIDPFNITLDNYPWGSNAYLMNNANALFFGYLIFSEEKYLKLSSKHINYILGTNSLDMTFVTGFGNNSPKYPHHRPSAAKKQAMPGMLVGGPADGLFDLKIKEIKSNSPKAKRYIDDEESYSTNEICIYWNSPFLLALTLLKSIYK